MQTGSCSGTPPHRRAMLGCPGSAPCAICSTPATFCLWTRLFWTLRRDGIAQYVAFVSGFPCWACVQGSHVPCVCWGCIPLKAVVRSCVYTAFSESILQGTCGCPAFGAVEGSAAVSTCARALVLSLVGTHWRAELLVLWSWCRPSRLPCAPSAALRDHLPAARQQRCLWSCPLGQGHSCCRVGPGPCSHGRPQDVTWVTDFLQGGPEGRGGAVGPGGRGLWVGPRQDGAVVGADDVTR